MQNPYPNQNPDSTASAPGYAPPPAAPAQGYAPPPASPAQGYAPPPASPAPGYAPPPASPAPGYAPPPASPAQGYAPPPTAPAPGYAPPPTAPAPGYAPPPTAPAQGYAPPPGHNPFGAFDNVQTRGSYDKDYLNEGLYILRCKQGKMPNQGSWCLEAVVEAAHDSAMRPGDTCTWFRQFGSGNMAETSMAEIKALVGVALFGLHPTNDARMKTKTQPGTGQIDARVTSAVINAVTQPGGFGDRLVACQVFPPKSENKPFRRSKFRAVTEADVQRAQQTGWTPELVREILAR